MKIQMIYDQQFLFSGQQATIALELQNELAAIKMKKRSKPIPRMLQFKTTGQTHCDICTAIRINNKSDWRDATVQDSQSIAESTGKSAAAAAEMGRRSIAILIRLQG